MKMKAVAEGGEACRGSNPLSFWDKRKYQASDFHLNIKCFERAMAQLEFVPTVVFPVL